MSTTFMVLTSKDWTDWQKIRMQLILDADELQPLTVQLVHDGHGPAAAMLSEFAADYGWQEIVFRRNVRTHGTHARAVAFEAMTDYLLEHECAPRVLAFLTQGDDTGAAQVQMTSEDWAIPTKVYTQEVVPCS